MPSSKTFDHARFTFALMLILALAAGCQSTTSTRTGGPAAARTAGDDDAYYDLGGFHREVTTTSPEAQLWFDRGLALMFGFNHEEAGRCFQRAAEADPGCAMAWWGIAHASGPYINNTQMDEAAVRRAVDAITAAERAAREHGASAVERALIRAEATRYVEPAPEDRSHLDRAYALAMRRTLRDHSDDADVVALCAEALMVLRPWEHWTPDGQPAPETPEIVQTLERGLAMAPDHPALCHFYIHTMEASPTPEKALPAANRLRSRVPCSGHLVHMPSHIDIRIGDYEAAALANQKAIAEDALYVQREGAMNFYTLYRVHNYHFLVYAAMFDGRSEVAMEAARELVDQIPEPMLVEMSDLLDAFVPTSLHVQVRFGRWEEILREPRPAEHLPMTTAVWHYARALAYAATGRVAQAEREQEAFVAARAAVPETSILFNNTCDDILGVAEAMIAGEIEYRRGNFDEAFAHLEEAVRRDDALNYDEPWGWMQPARHALGALLLEQGRFADAERVYVKDLERHPNNPWALHGLSACLRGQDRPGEAAEIEARFAKASRRCDVNMKASCYCAQAAMRPSQASAEE